jgi:PAS domain S-box-containing protein
MAGGSIYSILKLNTAAQWVAHSEQVKAQVNGVFGLVVGWESANRGYVITGNEDYFAPYQDAAAELDTRMAKLRMLVADNKAQMQRVEQLATLLHEKIGIMDQSRAARAQTGFAAAAAIVGSGKGKQIMDDIRVLTAQIRDEEDGLLNERQKSSNDQVQLSIAAALATSAVGLLVLGGAGWVITGQFRGRRAAEAALAKSRSDLQGILDNSPTGILLKDLQGRYILLNEPMRHLVEREPATCVGKLPEELFPPERAEKIHRQDEELLAAGVAREYDDELLGADGVRRTMRTVKFPLRDAAGKIYAVGGISTDITEHKRMEGELREAVAAAESASRTKSQFLANMSHELRTPLNSIIGFSEILSDQLFGPLNKKQEQYTANIQASGRHLLLLINDLLDLAKIEAGKMQIEPEPTAVAQLLQQGTVLARGLAERKGVELEIAPVEAGLCAWLDSARAKQIIYNLLSNAVKFTPKGGRVTIHAERVVQPRGPGRSEPWPGEWLRLTVADSGIGIAAEDIERIFAEFEQVDSTYARQQEGTGLGLALTRKLAQLHGGAVWAESPGCVNEGSTFIVMLPFGELGRNGEGHTALPAAAAAEPAAPHGSGPPRTNGRPLILVVEDDLQACHLMREHLAAGGYDMAHAGTGEEALRLAGSLQPAAITLDVLLPDANGMDVLARLKATRATSNIPVVIVSVTDDRPLGLSLGAAEFFVKPVSAEKLLDALARVRTRAQHEIQEVLVVDDEAAARESIRATLAPRGYAVRTTASGEEALRLIKERPPDVAIVDLTMPGMSGFELVSVLRQNPTTRGLPICIYTAKDLSATELHWLHEQSAAITPKPFREQLLNELERVCANTT